MLTLKSVFPWFFLFVFGVSSISVMAAHASEEKAVSLERITVTASKRESEATDFPGSISVKDDVFIEAHHIGSTKELIRFTPNVFYKTSTSGDSFVSRGISTIDTSLFSPTSLYVNDVAYPLSHMLDTTLFDIERVEVLRGPQSTLYGKNSESGVINVVMAEPGNELKARAFLEAGNYATYSGGVSFSGPVVQDTLFMGLTLFGYDTDGYKENLLSGEDDVASDQTLYARGALRWTPSHKLDVSLSLNATGKESGINNLRFEDGPNATDRFEVNNDGPNEVEQQQFVQALRVKYQFDGADLTAITSHLDFDRDFVHDFDRTPSGLGFSQIDLGQDNWSQEFRLASAKESTLSWLVGLYGSHESLDVSWTLHHVNPAMANSRDTDSELESIALFGQSTFSLTDRWSLTGGARLEHAAASGNQVYVHQTGSDTFDEDLSDTEILPMASLGYRITETIQAYATFSAGWLAGGYNYYSSTTQDAFTYDPEYTQNYEAGLKTSFLNNRLSANLAIFYTEIDDKQVKEEVPGGGPGVWKFTNAAKAHTAGGELEVNYLPFNGLELFAGIGYADAKIDAWTGTASGEAVDYSGNSLPWAPDLTGNVGVAYYMDNGLYLIADVFLAGKQYFDAANTLKDDGYALVNLKMGFLYNKYDISVGCKNLFDEAYANKKVKNSMGYTLVEDGPPMTLGVTLNWRY